MSPGGRRDSEFDVDTFFVTRGAASCVASARELIKLIHRTSQSPSSDVWWYNVYCELTSLLDMLVLGLTIYSETDVHTAGMVVKLAQLCHPLEQIVSASSLGQSWILCRETLSKMSSYGQVPRRCLESLEAIQQKISRLEQCNANTHPFLTTLANFCLQ
jgi:hypothetical protein